MSMPTPENPHTLRKQGYELVYWDGNAASGPQGATRVVLYQWVEINAQTRTRYNVGDNLRRPFY